MEDEKVRKLAETLIKSGLATSESLAIEKAKEMLNIQERTKIRPSMETEKRVDIENEDKTVDDLMKEAGVEAEEGKKDEETEEKETVEEVTEEDAQEEPEEESAEEEKEIAGEENAEEEEGEEITIEEQAEEPEEEKPEKELKKPTYDEEKKVDISEMFNYGKR